MKKNYLVSLIVSLFSGLVFGVGLVLSGMTNPDKVLNFLDVAGHWDPSLLFVLGGAVGVTVLSFRFILRRKAPLLEDHFHLSDAKKIDGRLVAGALVFGLGWGISGYCPGPALTLLANPGWETWIFLPAMLLGLFVHKATSRL